MPRIAAIFLTLCALLAHAQKPPKWTLQYFFDEKDKLFRITDLAFPSEKRGIAVGAIFDQNDGDSKSMALVTNDAGAHWAQVPLKDFPRSIFFLNDSQGWMVTARGLWFTEESGRSWKRISEQIKPNRKLQDAPPGGLINRVWFTDAQHGYAIGYQKSVYESKDGGRTWVALTEAAKPVSQADFSVYTSIWFADANRGVIAGSYFPPERDPVAWMNPRRLLSRRRPATPSFELDTRDSGARWTSSTAPQYGTISLLRLAGQNGLAVFTYDDSFEWPSIVQRIDLKTGKSQAVLRRKDRVVTGAALFPDGRAFVAAVEPVGFLRSAPIPGKVKILTVANVRDARRVEEEPVEQIATLGEKPAPATKKKPVQTDDWVEMNVDYRAVASSVVLAGPDAAHQWAATDTGMILRLVQ